MSRRPARPIERRARGLEIEGRAAAFLESKGFLILARNHHSRRGEVDIIAQAGEVIAFVEVRSRTFADFDSPSATVSWRKRRRIISAATEWAARRGVLESHALRFDVIAVVERGGGGDDAPSIEWIQAAFDATGAI